MISNYSDLKAEIQNHLDTDALPVATMISLAEQRLRKDIRIRELIVRATATVTRRTISLPGDFQEMKFLRLLDDDGKPSSGLDQVTLAEITESAAKDSNALHHHHHHHHQAATQYAVIGEELEFDREVEAGQEFDVEMFYYKKFTALSDANPTNEVLEEVPTAYLYASLLAATPYILNDERIPTWNSFYTAAKEAANEVDRRRAGPLQPRMRHHAAV